MNMSEKSRVIKVDYLARVEGEGALYVKIKEGKVIDVKFKIFEPPRFFEAFLRGRKFSEAPDITARICGICPIAYETSAVQAFERLFGIEIEESVRELRRLIYFGEWIESHMLHAFLLHAPDFLGYQDALQMAKDHPEIVKKALKAKKIGNDIVIFLGGREIHPVSLRVGGFYKVPRRRELESLRERVKEGRQLALDLLNWATTLDYPDFEQDYEFVSLRHPEEYGIIEGRIVSNKGLNIDWSEYDDNFVEEHIPYTNALHSKIKDRGYYMVGPLARLNLNYDKLSPEVKQELENLGIRLPILNPFKSIIARCVETFYAYDEALKIIENYKEPPKPYADYKVKAGVAYGCSEAPRGILYHRYEVSQDGTIISAKIVPPTAQNQGRVEEDLRNLIPKMLNLSKEELTWRCEQAIRNYDPCISCSVHFLKLRIEYD